MCGCCSSLARGRPQARPGAFLSEIGPFHPLLCPGPKRRLAGVAGQGGEFCPHGAARRGHRWPVPKRRLKPSRAVPGCSQGPCSRPPRPQGSQAGSEACGHHFLKHEDKGSFPGPGEPLPSGRRRGLGVRTWALGSAGATGRGRSGRRAPCARAQPGPLSLFPPLRSGSDPGAFLGGGCEGSESGALRWEQARAPFRGTEGGDLSVAQSNGR